MPSTETDNMQTEENLKAGHPPAVKAGGMRVARHRQTSAGETKEKSEMTPEEQEEYGTSPPKETREKQIIVSGAAIKEDKAFPPEAVKHYHEQPLPSKEYRHDMSRHKKCSYLGIHQPR